MFIPSWKLLVERKRLCTDKICGFPLYTIHLRKGKPDTKALDFVGSIVTVKPLGKKLQLLWADACNGIFHCEPYAFPFGCKARYAEMHKEVKTEFFVYDKATKQAIGIAGLKEMKPSVYTVTDIALCPDFHGKGYGNQILMAFISLAFDELDATELHYDCFKQNEVSKRLALSCGFTYTHSEEAELTKDGEKVILDYYEVRK